MVAGLNSLPDDPDAAALPPMQQGTKLVFFVDGHDGPFSTLGEAKKVSAEGGGAKIRPRRI